MSAKDSLFDRSRGLVCVARALVDESREAQERATTIVARARAVIKRAQGAADDRHEEKRLALATRTALARAR